MFTYTLVTALCAGGARARILISALRARVSARCRGFRTIGARGGSEGRSGHVYGSPSESGRPAGRRPPASPRGAVARGVVFASSSLQLASAASEQRRTRTPRTAPEAHEHRLLAGVKYDSTSKGDKVDSTTRNRILQGGDSVYESWRNLSFRYIGGGI